MAFEEKRAKASLFSSLQDIPCQTCLRVLRQKRTMPLELGGTICGSWVASPHGSEICGLHAMPVATF